MKIVSCKTVKVLPDDTRLVEALILADTTPDPLPTTGADVEGLMDGDTFAPMSILYVVDPAAEHKIYIADESGSFVGQ